MRRPTPRAQRERCAQAGWRAPWFFAKPVSRPRLRAGHFAPASTPFGNLIGLSRHGQADQHYRRTTGTLRGRASVDREHCAGDAAGAVAHQELNCVGDIIDVGQAAQGTAAHDLLALGADQPLRHVGVEKAGGDGVDVDAEPADLARQRAGKSDHRSFGGRIGGKPAIAGKPDDGGDVDDAAHAFRHHRAHNVLGEHDRRQRIETHNRETRFASTNWSDRCFLWKQMVA